jgi:hypothetical protein
MKQDGEPPFLQVNMYATAGPLVLESPYLMLGCLPDSLIIDGDPGSLLAKLSH